MSVATRAIVQGKIAQVSNRSGKSAKTGKDYSIDTVLVLGEYCIAEVRIPEGFEIPSSGDDVVYGITVGVYMDDDSNDLSKVLEHRKSQQQKAA